MRQVRVVAVEMMAAFVLHDIESFRIEFGPSRHLLYIVDAGLHVKTSVDEWLVGPLTIELRREMCILMGPTPIRESQLPRKLPPAIAAAEWASRSV